MRWGIKGLIPIILGSPSPGGGGPGHSLTSTNPPPSIEEVGRMITGKFGSGKRCPPGYIWSHKKQRCVHVHGRERKYFRKD